MEERGVVFDIQRWSIRDGYGIRTNVFFKGCPLRCRWCSNPESQRAFPELAFFPDKCIHCGRCVENCAHHALSSGSAERPMDDSICVKHCYAQPDGFACTRQCYAEALKVMGSEMTVNQVMKEVLSDKKIYDSSGGGVTFTGGEPFMQPRFLCELLKACKDEGVHTTIETCAYTEWENIQAALPYLNFLFVDLKMVDAKLHEEYTGVGNEQILRNLVRINESIQAQNTVLVVRMPVIPGVNDTEEGVAAQAEWIVRHLNQVKVFQLLPYHRLGRGKYLNIGRTYEMEDCAPPSEERMKRLNAIVEARGLKTTYE